MYCSFKFVISTLGPEEKKQNINYLCSDRSWDYELDCSFDKNNNQLVLLYLSICYIIYNNKMDG